MSIFLGVHKFPVGPDTDDLTSQGWGKYKQAATNMGLKPLKVLVSLEKGVAYCQTEASSEEQVREAHEKAQIPLEDLIEVKSLE